MPQNFYERRLVSAPSATITSHATASNINAGTARGVKFYIDITAFSGTSITYTIQCVDPATGTLSTVLASAAKSATGGFTLTVAPGVATVSNVALGDFVPRIFRLQTSGTITSVTHRISYELLS